MGNVAEEPEGSTWVHFSYKCKPKPCIFPMASPSVVKLYGRRPESKKKIGVGNCVRNFFNPKVSSILFKQSLSFPKHLPGVELNCCIVFGIKMLLAEKNYFVFL